MMLIREQVEELHRLIVGREKSSEDVDRLWELLPLVNSTDAALRARVLELEQKSQRFDRELAKAIEIDEATNNERETELNTLKQQLASITQEREEAVRIMNGVIRELKIEKQSLAESTTQLQARESTIAAQQQELDRRRQWVTKLDVARDTIMRLEDELKGHTDRALIVLNQFHAVCVEKQAQGETIVRLEDRVKELEEWGANVKRILESDAVTSAFTMAFVHGWKYQGEHVTYEILQARQARGGGGKASSSSPM